MGQLDPMATPLPRSIPSQPRGETKLQEEPDDAPLPINNKKRKAESEEEWDDEEPVDEGTTAKQPPKNNQKKERFYGTKEEKDRLKGQKEKIESFDWSVFAKSEKPRAILAAKHHHLEVLRKQHGRDWKKKSPSSNLTFPSRQEIHQNPLWYNNTKNLACLAVRALPKYLRNEVVMDREAERKRLKREEGAVCRFCNKKLIEGEASQVR